VKVLFDTNIALDLLLNRKPFADFAAYLLSKSGTFDFENSTLPVYSPNEFINMINSLRGD